MKPNGSTENRHTAVDAETTGPAFDREAFLARVRGMTPPDREASYHSMGQEDLDELAALKATAMHNRYVAMVPGDYRKATISDLRDPTLGADMVKWWESGTRNMVLCGPVGSGKTQAAFALYHQVMNLVRLPAACTMIGYLDDLKQAFNGLPSFAKTYEDADFLVLDDLGAEVLSDWQREKITDLLDTRTRQCLRTLITTNLKQEEVEAKYGPRIASRLSGWWRPVVGHDIRRVEW